MSRRGGLEVAPVCMQTERRGGGLSRGAMIVAVATQIMTIMAMTVDGPGVRSLGELLWVLGSSRSS